VIKYLGSKRRVLPHIVSCVGALPDVRTALDLFSGTARVGHALKRMGLTVHANDHNAYAAALATCYVQADARKWQRKAERLVVELDALEGVPGWFTETYCERSRFLRPENGARVDAIRERIAALSLEPELEAIVLVSLIEAADRVDSTVGLQMAYLKSWAPRASQRLTLRVPELLPGKGSASCLDARSCAARRSVDLAYLDPPYNQHSYLGNYHLWESVVRWDKPDVYGVAMKRTDVKERGSAFNRKGSIEAAFREVVETVRARYLVVSFNDEGYLGLETVRSVLATRGAIEELAIEHPRYIGHRIGIYNPQGERVGTPGKASNHEHLFVVGASVAERRALREVARAAS
jgi:adenine-specific DNA-methyltransferase